MTTAPPRGLAVGAAHNQMVALPRRARCYGCGSTTVAAVCSSCRRLLCGKHDRNGDLTDAWRANDDTAPKARERVETPQPDGPGSDGEQDTTAVPDGAPGSEQSAAVLIAPERPERRPTPKRVAERHFCPDCLPRGRPHDPVMQAATAEVALGGVTAIWSPWIGGLLAAVGLGRAGWRIVRDRRRRPAPPPPPLVLDPTITMLGLTETLVGEVRRQADRSHSAVTDVSGTVRMEAVWSRIHTTAVVDHRRRQGFSADEAVTFSAGSLVLTGPGRLTRPADDGASPMLVPLRSTTAEHPVLANAAGRGDARWTYTAAYTVDTPKAGSPTPVWVTAALAPGSGGRALELEVQWRLTDPVDEVARRTTAPLAERIDELRLSVPGAWGDVENMDGAEQWTTTNVVEGRREIAWERATLDPSDRGRLRLTVSFQRRLLDDEDVLPIVDGTLRMTFAKALSGVTGVQVHASGGGRRLDGATQRCTVRTEVELALDLDLRGLRYQEVRTVPDPARDGPEPRQERRRFRGVAPDHKTVARLTDLLSDQGYYVKAVVENPTQSTGGRRTRVWDVNGRRYNGVHPINFHIDLTGEEVDRPDRGARGSARKSTTTVRLNVSGTYANPDMEHDIVAEQAQLWDRIHACLDPTGRVPAESVDSAAVEEVSRLRQAAITVRTALQAAYESGEPCEQVLPRLIGLVDDEFGLLAGDP